jgi:hypothetical protein
MSGSKGQNGATKAAPSPPIAARLNRTSPGGNGVKLASSHPANEETNPEKMRGQDDYVCGVFTLFVSGQDLVSLSHANEVINGRLSWSSISDFGIPMATA